MLVLVSSEGEGERGEGENESGKCGRGGVLGRDCDETSGVHSFPNSLIP